MDMSKLGHQLLLIKLMTSTKRIKIKLYWNVNHDIWTKHAGLTRSLEEQSCKWNSN